MDKSLTYEEDLTPHLIQGKVLITPHSLNHNRAARNIFRLFDNYLDRKDSEVFSWGVTLFLTAMHRLLPDMMVVCDPGKVREDGVHGAPDLIAEVLSPATIPIPLLQKPGAWGGGGGVCFPSNQILGGGGCRSGSPMQVSYQGSGSNRKRGRPP